MSSIRWKLASVVTDEDNTEDDMAFFGLINIETGGHFVVSISAPKHASATEYLSALRAAAAFFQQTADGTLPEGAELASLPKNLIN